MTTAAARAFALVAIVLIASGGAASRAAADAVTPGSVPRERIVARVGAAAIRQRDVDLRLAVLSARGVEDAGPRRATVELLREALDAEVARSLGIAATPADVAALDRHATSTSRDPATLERLRTLLGADDFARQVLLPRVVALELRDRFASSHRGAVAAAFDAWYRQLAAAVVIDIDEPIASDVCATQGEVWWLQRPCRRRPDRQGDAITPAPVRPEASRTAVAHP